MNIRYTQMSTGPKNNQPSRYSHSACASCKKIWENSKPVPPRTPKARHISRLPRLYLKSTTAKTSASSQKVLTCSQPPASKSTHLAASTSSQKVVEKATPLEPDPILPCDFTSTEELLREAEDFYNNYSFPSALYFPTIETNALSFLNLIEILLKTYDGLCIGECHTHSTPKYVLFANMPFLKKLGVDVLYIEGYDELQKELDEYLLATELELPGPIQKRIECFPSTGVGGYTECDVIKASKEAGIRIVNIDSAAAHAPTKNAQGVRGILRVVAMNYQAKLIIDRDRTLHKPRKSLIYAGAAHTNPIAGVPGLGQLYQFPSLTFRDAFGKVCTGASTTTIPSCFIEKDRIERYSDDKRKEHHDFYLSMDKPTK